jgi:predicted PurR-regulated permease PerM
LYFEGVTFVNKFKERADSMNESPPEPDEFQVTHRVQIEVTWKSILRVLLGVLVAYAAIQLWIIFKILILSSLLAVALYPIVTWAGRRKWPQWVGYLLAIATLLFLVAGCFLIIGPMAFHQISVLGDSLPRLRDQIIAQLPATGPVHQALQNSMSPGTVADSRLLLQKALLLIETTLGGLIYVVVVMALAVYLILDGSRALGWLTLYLPAAEREKVAEALKQISRLVSSYVAGQCLVSAFCAAYLFVVLQLLGVPMALLLGIIAGICDILPIIGFFIAVFLAMTIGFSVSPTTAALIFVLYGAYHLFENFFIVPMVYGKKLRLSKLAVPLAVAVGGLLAGVVGAIAVLPLLAAYPVIERLWITPRLKLQKTPADEVRMK